MILFLGLGHADSCGLEDLNLGGKIVLDAGLDVGVSLVLGLVSG
jgi:hypothetical protein